MHKEPLSHKIIHWLNHLRSVTRLIIGVVFALAMNFVLAGIHMEWLTRVMLGWDCYCICVLTIILITWATTDPQQIRLLARRQDSSRGIVFVLVIAACITSLIAVLDLLNHKKGWLLPKGAEAGIYLSGVVVWGDRGGAVYRRIRGRAADKSARTGTHRRRAARGGDDYGNLPGSQLRMRPALLLDQLRGQ